jgi:sialate O-acetylesterase
MLRQSAYRTCLVGSVVGLCLLAAGAPAARQQDRGLRLPALISDHMVLQRDIAVSLWGWAAPGASVSASMNGQTASATTDAGGRWRTWLNPMPAGGPYDLVIRADREVTIRDVLVGDVWVGSGQSNMEWPVRQTTNAAQEVAAASFPHIRLFTVPRKVADAPQDDLAGEWKLTTPET